MQCVTLLLILVDTGLRELYLTLLVTGIHCTKWWVWKHICQYQWNWDKPYSLGCNHLCPMIWLQACLHWRCAYFQTLPWSDTILVVDWDILYKLCGSANKWSKWFVFSGKIWWQFFSCNKACSKYRTRSTTTPKYTLTQCLVFLALAIFPRLFLSKCDFRAQWETNHLGLIIIILPVSCLFFALQEIDWFTNLEQTPLNRSQQLPAPYKRLIDEIKQN